MGKWPAPVSSANLYELGPYLDGFVGTDGETADLYDAVINKGWTRMVVTTGATISADLTITTSNIFIYSFNSPRSLDLGAKIITINADQCRLSGFSVSGAGSGIVIATGADDNFLDGLQVQSASGVGIDVQGTAANNRITDCRIVSCGSHGIQVGASAGVTFIHKTQAISNGGWGILDSAALIVEGGNHLTGNTSGARSTSSTYIDGKSKIA